MHAGHSCARRHGAERLPQQQDGVRRRRRGSLRGERHRLLLLLQKRLPVQRSQQMRRCGRPAAHTVEVKAACNPGCFISQIRTSVSSLECVPTCATTPKDPTSAAATNTSPKSTRPARPMVSSERRDAAVLPSCVFGSATMLLFFFLFFMPL